MLAKPNDEEPTKSCKQTQVRKSLIESKTYIWGEERLFGVTQSITSEHDHQPYLGTKPFFNVLMVATSVLKAKAKTVSSMLELNNVLGIDTVPAFALPKAERAIAVSLFAELCWK